MSLPREQLGTRDVADAGVDELVVDERIVGEDIATEGDQQAGDELTDAAGADDPGRPAVQAAAEQTVEGEVAVADAQVGAMDVAVEGEDEGQRVLGDGLG